MFPLEGIIDDYLWRFVASNNCFFLSAKLVTGPEGNQLYDHVTPAQQKNAAIVNSLFQLHQAVAKVTAINV